MYGNIFLIFAVCEMLAPSVTVIMQLKEEAVLKYNSKEIKKSSWLSPLFQVESLNCKSNLSVVTEASVAVRVFNLSL